MTSNVTTGMGGMTTGPGGPGSVTAGPGGGASTGGGSDPAATSSVAGTGASSTTTSSTSASSTSTGGIMCVDPKTDCLAPAVCYSTICANGGCFTSPLDAGTVTAGQTTGNCKKSICDGTGNATDIPDNNDVPAPNSDCYTASCSAGVPKQTARPINSPCTSNGGSYCDGAGTCV